MPTTNAQIRERFDDGRYLNDGATLNVATDEPANDADTVVAEGTDIHVVDIDGTNSVDLDAAAQAGRVVRVVVDDDTGTAAAFTDADFLGTGPSNLTASGQSATVANVNGETTGWITLAEGSA